jgi:TATA-box binding protein (TBP) (component of TFIID and TFIIIB)
MENAEVVQASSLRISTKVITADYGSPIDRGILFQHVQKVLIPLWYPGEGILKMEHEKQIIGCSSKDAFSKRKISEKTFFNQSTFVLRKAVNPEKTKFKEVNCKIFGNGGVQMTGIPSEEFGQEVLQWLLDILKTIDAPIFQATPGLYKFRVKLINSDFTVAHPIRRDILHNILTRYYGLFSTFEGTIYQGVNTKYYYNDQNPRKEDKPGICMCMKKCRGQGSGSGSGECKKITMAIFQTGKIIITGARFMYQIEEAYQFLLNVLHKHAYDVLRIPDPAQKVPEVPQKAKRASRRKKGLVKIA